MEYLGILSLSLSIAFIGVNNPEPVTQAHAVNNGRKNVSVDPDLLQRVVKAEEHSGLKGPDIVEMIEV
jgi:hypothetical protein